MGGGDNKIYMKVAGVPLLSHSIEAFVASGVIDGIVVAARAGEEERARECLSGCPLVTKVVTGGSTRAQSVLNGLYAIPGCDIVAVHDGARCMVTPEVIRRCVASAKERGSGVAAVRAVNTLRRVSDGVLGEMVDRESTVEIQTPQAFSYALLMEAYKKAEAEGFAATDESLIVSRAGGSVYQAEGDPSNIKITTSADIDYVRAMRGDMRCGSGFDSHAFVSGRPLILGGLTVEHDRGLLGWSDGDALTHAVMDALLGAAGLPDIGTLYPDTDERYHGISSLLLLRDTVSRVREAGYRIASIDATVICDAPMIAPIKDGMIQRLAEGAGLPRERVNVKGKRAEGMNNPDVLMVYAVAALFAFTNG